LYNGHTLIYNESLGFGAGGAKYAGETTFVKMADFRVSMFLSTGEASDMAKSTKSGQSSKG